MTPLGRAPNAPDPAAALIALIAERDRLAALADSLWAENETLLTRMAALEDQLGIAP